MPQHAVHRDNEQGTKPKGLPCDTPALSPEKSIRLCKQEAAEE